MESRCDHPSQRHLVVAITDEDASVHRLNPDVVPAPAGAGRAYMTEADFLTIGSQLGHEELEGLKSTLLRMSRETPSACGDGWRKASAGRTRSKTKSRAQ